MAFGQCFLLVGVEIEKTRRDRVAAIVHADQQLAPRAESHFAGSDHALDLRHFTRPRIAQLDDAGFIFVAQRDVQGKVHGAHQTQLAQGFLHGRQRPCSRRSVGGRGRGVHDKMDRIGHRARRCAWCKRHRGRLSISAKKGHQDGAGGACACVCGAKAAALVTAARRMKGQRRQATRFFPAWMAMAGKGLRVFLINPFFD